MTPYIFPPHYEFLEYSHPLKKRGLRAFWEYADATTKDMQLRHAAAKQQLIHLNAKDIQTTQNPEELAEDMVTNLSEREIIDVPDLTSRENPVDLLCWPQLKDFSDLFCSKADVEMMKHLVAYMHDELGNEDQLTMADIQAALTRYEYEDPLLDPEAADVADSYVKLARMMQRASFEQAARYFLQAFEDSYVIANEHLEPYAWQKATRSNRLAHQADYSVLMSATEEDADAGKGTEVGWNGDYTRDMVINYATALILNLKTIQMMKKEHPSLNVSLYKNRANACLDELYVALACKDKTFENPAAINSETTGVRTFTSHIKTLEKKYREQLAGRLEIQINQVNNELNLMPPEDLEKMINRTFDGRTR